MIFLLNVFQSSLDLLFESSVYILFGLLVSGLLRVFLSPNSVAQLFVYGRFTSVL